MWKIQTDEDESMVENGLVYHLRYCEVIFANADLITNTLEHV